MKKIKCEKCGVKNDPDDKQCSYCDTKLPKQPSRTNKKKPNLFWRKKSTRFGAAILVLWLCLLVINFFYQIRVEDIYAQSKYLDESIATQADLSSPAAIMPPSYDELVKEAVGLSRSFIFIFKKADSEKLSELLREKYNNNLVIIENDKDATWTANLWGTMYKDPDCAKKYGNENCKVAIMKMVDGIAPHTKKISAAKDKNIQIDKRIEDLFLISESN